MGREPVTPAIRMLRAEGIAHEGFVFDYKRFPGAAGAAEALEIELHSAIKTVVFKTDRNDGVIVLMNGDLEVSTKNLARVLGVKTAEPASQRDARRWTGYQFGGTSPFGTRHEMPILIHDEIPRMEAIYINGGSRGFLIRMRTADLMRVLEPTIADLAM